MNEEVVRLKRDSRFKNYEIDDFNINQFLIIEEELNNCESCNGLSECKNIQKGYIHTPVLGGCDYNFPLKACSYKVSANKEKLSKGTLKTKYVSKMYESASLDDFETNTQSRKKAFEYAVSFLSTYKRDNFVKGLYIYGGYGSGKTFFSAALANELTKKGFSVLMIYFPDLVREIKTLQFKAELEDLINELKMVDILMIDDLGGENINSFVRDDVLGPILNYRLQDRKAVFITTNLKQEELMNHFSQTREEAFNNSSDEIKASRIMRRIADLTVGCDFKNSRYNGDL